ncbi:GNAT family N-acetyltransferase [Halovenus sp. WSH3]|uniref:GNAT family N-acetyltransferase n=1 Tax=Halovenus carboxidivorans TaxID=2692199 RepID=A0A6B0T8G5_9EURY|nr:GNAT family N-acetyltransferase [Halovenus carboxidivorans]MXR51501.1 GNAT family N-acetyltransferase [Halovenus carboxidivorans]
MDVREARPQDRPAIRDVARRSLQTSYSLTPSAINGAVEEWYDENRLMEMLSDDDKLLLVATTDEQLVAFSESHRTDENTAELLWLHVDPDYRGESYGEVLYEETREHLAELGVTSIQARVLADNVGGNTFYQNRGLSKVGEEQVEIDGTSYVENVYAEVEQEGIEPLELTEQTVYIDHDNTEQGSIAPFRVIYTEEDGEDIYGYWCTKCETQANAMDAMGRIQCDTCGNARKPTRWDSAYL